MKLNDFSPLQQKAILLKDQNVLVSAGAGSGKTAVLIQRLYEILKDGNTTIDQLLVLTFTNFAAKELKIRLKEKLEENSETAHLARLVDASDITTFDSFALKTVKKYGYVLDLNPEIAIFDNGLYNIKRRQFIEDVLAVKYQNNDAALFEFVKTYLKNNDNDLINLVIDFDRKVSLEIDSGEYIDNFLARNYGPLILDKNLVEYSQLINEKMAIIYELINLIDNDDVRTIYENWSLQFSGLTTYQDYLKVISDIKLPTIPKALKGEYDEDMSLLGEIKSQYKVVKEFFLTGSLEEITSIFARERKVASFVVDIYRDYKAKMDNFKQNYNIYTFSDIARFAYALVTKDELNEIIKDNYKYILVDEYQDTSDIQEAFVQALANNNVYMVGDIKQSIYGFRNANPTIFRYKYEHYSQNDGGALINLVDNYRSRREVVEGVNNMLNVIMSDEYGGASYQKSHQIGVGNQFYDLHKAINQNYELDVFEYEIEQKMTNDEKEAYLIGVDIINKIASGYQVLDKDSKAFRPSRYSDFTILTRRRNLIDTFIQTFNTLQIPLYTSDNQDAKANNVVQVLLSALKLFLTISNRDFTDEFRLAFTSFARGFIYQEDDQTIYNMMANNSKEYLHSDIFKRFSNLVTNYIDAPPSLIVQAIVDEFDFNKQLITLGDVDKNRKTLLTIMQMVASLEKIDMDFATIVAHFDNYDEQDEKIEIALTENVDNVVTLMTIHGSKGLEFPIVYFTGFVGRFNFKSLNSTFNVSSRYGLILPLGQLNKAKSINYHLNYQASVKELISEEIRLLYVGLTRAKEKMIVFAPHHEKEYITRVASAKSLLNLLEITKYYHAHKQSVTSGDQLTAPENRKSATHDFKLIEFSFPLTLVEKKQASVKLEYSDDINRDYLQLGTRLHRYLEVVNFDTKDISFIAQTEERAIIDRVLKLDIFAEITSAQVFREYRFYQREQELEAVIDLFILKTDHIKLIDYKLFTIEEDKYLSQLKVYKDFLETTFKLPVKTYLLSIVKGQYKYIKALE